MANDRDGRVEQVGQPEVVEADQRHPASGASIA